jgi:hypothetical protein
MCRVSHEQAQRVQDLAQATKPRKSSKRNARDHVKAIFDEVERKVIERGHKEGLAPGVAYLVSEVFKEARRRARAQALLQVLAWRFGQVPEAVAARVWRSSKKTLDRWLQRALGAATLRDVFSR